MSLPPIEVRGLAIAQIPYSEELSLIPKGSDSILIKADMGQLYVLRREKPIEKLLAIVAEYDGIGFTTKHNGSIRYRTVDNQESFVAECIRSGLAVVSPLFRTDEGLIFPFIEGVTCSEFLSKENSRENVAKMISVYMKDLLTAHSKSIVYGDRWGPNTIVTPDNSIQHIDLDLELQGETAKEFELAQSALSRLHPWNVYRLHLGIIQTKAHSVLI